MKKIELSKKGNTLLENFDEAAQIQGWQSDQGSEKNAIEAEEKYLAEKETLKKYILRLEKRIRKEKATSESFEIASGIRFLFENKTVSKTKKVKQLEGIIEMCEMMLDTLT